MDERLAIREKTKQHYNQHVEEGVSTAAVRTLDLAMFAVIQRCMQ
jgi:hypothetical protein